MHRLFVASRLPAEIRRFLLLHQGGVPGARWQDDDQLHMTLRFVGEVDGRTAADLVAALAGVRADPVEVRIEGVGLFDRRGVPDTLWFGVTPVDPLTMLHRKIDRAVVGLGLDPERRVYKPHVTIARFSRRGGDASAFLASNAGAASPPFRIDGFTLFESHLGRDGARYRPVETYALGR